MERAINLLSTLDRSSQRFSIAWKKARSKASERFVHDLRVAARRLMATLELVGTVFKTDDVLPATERLRKALKRMGSLRDLHVLIDTLAKLPASPAIADFRRHLKRKAKRETAHVKRSLKSGRRRRLERRLVRLNADLTERVGAVDDSVVRERIERLLVVRRQEYQSERQRFKPKDPESLHAMRIALKNLRYAVEAAAADAGEGAPLSIREMRSAQNAMGAAHDLAILMAKLDRWATAADKPAAAAATRRRLSRKLNRIVARIADNPPLLDHGVRSGAGPIGETTRAARLPSKSPPTDLSASSAAGNPPVNEVEQPRTAGA